MKRIPDLPKRDPDEQVLVTLRLLNNLRDDYGVLRAATLRIAGIDPRKFQSHMPGWIDRIALARILRPRWQLELAYRRRNEAIELGKKAAKMQDDKQQMLFI